MVGGGPLDASAGAERLVEVFGADAVVVAAEVHADRRGRLTAFDSAALPFAVRRVFAVTDVPAGAVRGGHRHSRGVQALFCLRGRIEVELRRGGDRLVVLLRADGIGVQFAAGVWAQQTYLDADSELLVLASEPYDESTYDVSDG